MTAPLVEGGGPVQSAFWFMGVFLAAAHRSWNQGPASSCSWPLSLHMALRPLLGESGQPPPHVEPEVSRLWAGLQTLHPYHTGGRSLLACRPAGPEAETQGEGHQLLPCSEGAPAQAWVCGASAFSRLPVGSPGIESLVCFLPQSGSRFL